MLSKRQDRKFRRLLSAGYTVVSDRRSPEGDEPKAGEEEKKLTSIVIGTTQTGSTSHGGKHASRQVEDSPNAANAGKRPRGCRGGQKKRSQDKRRRIAKVQSRIQVQRSNQSGSTSVYSPQPLEVSPELLASAESSAKLLGELVGRSAIKVKR
ncbi:MAG TPA: hypothetical protein VNG90_01895, partial [Candidatus Acidoferrum sp.]|nr:hypothetical protein [Candidatus Acidoferrum sp.]